MIAVSGCASGPLPTDGCEWTRPIRPTPHDVDVISDRLAGDILSHNEAGARVCGWEA